MLNNESTPRFCPSCSIQVPPKTRKFCPACGSEMAAESSAGAAPVASPPLAQSRPIEPPGQQLEYEPSAPPTAVALPLVLGAGGALIGALLWAGVAYATGWEIGYVAWVIGGLVGGGVVLGGGHGVVLAAAAAGLALVGIFGGKLHGTHLLVEHQITQMAEMFDPQGFEQTRTMMRQLSGESASPLGEGEFDLSAEERAEWEQLSEADRASFECFLDPDYTFEQWRDDACDEMRAQLSAWDLIRDNLNALDLLFVLLGLTTAFSIVQRSSQAS